MNRKGLGLIGGHDRIARVRELDPIIVAQYEHTGPGQAFDEAFAGAGLWYIPLRAIAGSEGAVRTTVTLRASVEVMPMFRTKKTREAVCYLLKGLGGNSTYGAITKLLYIADRESMRKQARPITGDAMYALPQGPILSVVLERLNGSHPEFDDLIENGPNYEISLIGDEVPCDLTYSDLAILKFVLEKYGALSWDMLKAETHQFDEWKKYDKGQDTWSLISPADVAEALGFSPEQKQALAQNLEERDSIASFFHSLGAPAIAAL